MSLALVFRNQPKPNLFRSAILAATGIPGATDILICSGFFQNGFKGSPYQVSKEGGLVHKLKASGAKVTTVGVHNPYWKKPYSDFVQDLSAAGVIVTQKQPKGLHWHAKVFIVETKNGPVFGAIGSSNLTRNAFSTCTPFNYEADVLLWVPQAKGVSAAVNGVLRDAESTQVVRARYSPRLNAGLRVKDRLAMLRDQILQAAA
jgi:hypothetical protein